MAKIKYIRPASDKSITHRAIILSSIANGSVVVNNALFSDDTLRTLKTVQMLGVDVKTNDKKLTIIGKGRFSLQEPKDILYMGNSGTSARLFAGLLSGCEFASFMTGDDSLRRRPMGRIIKPLGIMGAKILARGDGFLPIAISGGNLKGIDYNMSIASAQVKSAILIAGLYSDYPVKVCEPYKSRDHTENMLKAFGVDVVVENTCVSLGVNRELNGNFDINVPADISSSAFFMVYTALKEGAELILNDVLLNSTRSGILDVFNEVGVRWEILNDKVEKFERIGDILVRYSPNLKPFSVKGELVPRLIDEIPILAILASFCDGISEIRDAKDLRKKESDRIKAICENLEKIGVKIEEFEDGFRVYGCKNPKLRPALIDTYGDHRIAMSFLVLEAVIGVGIRVSETHSILTSYPNFIDHLSYISS